MTIDEIAPWLFARVSGGVRWGLERTEELLAGVDDPHRHFDSVLVGGTNGKGSVAALCDSVLRARGGLRVGLYTSPHLISLAERIRIDGRPIEAHRLGAIASRLRPAIEKSGATFFESTTAMAFLAFAEAQVDVVIAEVGLGGRLDATNVLEPQVTGVTNVALDHTEYLGTTIESIAYEKAGIFKAGVPALIGEESATAAGILAEQGTRAGAQVMHLKDLSVVRKVEIGPEGTNFTLSSRHWGELSARVPLIGQHQARNAAFAAELLALLRPGLAPDQTAILEGFAAARWAGRLQIERIAGTTWVFDVAHNPAGATALAAALGDLRLERPVIGVVSVLRDKEWGPMLRSLGSVVDGLVLTTPSSAPAARRWDVEEAGAWCRAEIAVPTRVLVDFESALMRATTLAGPGTVVVTGSVHMVGDAMSALGVPV